MSQANWTDLIGAPPLPERERRSSLPPGLMNFLTDWEAWLTLGLVMLVFLSVARSIDSANWVPEMPSIMGISFIAIVTGFLLARIKVPEPLLHLASLLVGTVVVTWLVM